jgi:hypothetical protein
VTGTVPSSTRRAGRAPQSLALLGTALVALALLALALLPTAAASQPVETDSLETDSLGTDSAAVEPFELTGTWRGAYVRGGAVQRVSATVAVRQDTPRVELYAPGWAYFGRRGPHPVARTSDGRLAFDSHYGRAQVDVDSTYRELVGTAGDHEPSIRLHLKKSPVPAPAAPDTQNIRFESGSATLAGTVVLPAGAGPHPGVVYVAGRGCASRRGGLRRLRWLAQQGIAGLAYDNRGSGRSSGDCKTTTLQTESRDVQAALRTLRRRAEVDAERVGAWANSAGGWYVPHAAARSETPPSFIAMQGGPATSVQGQQTDNAQEIAGELGLAPSDSAAFLRYVDLMFATDRPDEAVFDEMQSLLDHGERTGWADAFLVRDPAIGDVPATAAGLDSLWVRRYAYDPAEDLRRLRVPVLALYGAEDGIVPAAENALLMRRLLRENDRARVAVIPEAGHGFGNGSVLRTLDTPRGRLDTHYWKFFRLAPDFQALLLDFLRSHARAEGTSGDAASGSWAEEAEAGHRDT